MVSTKSNPTNKLSKLKLVANQYVGQLYKQDTRGRWRKFACIGNSGIALDFVDYLRRLGHAVEVEFMEIEE